jgi:leader peptidase (prepilin peptidase)/N-methyltransferase
MIIAIVVVVGLCLGSFVNALVWRLREEISIAHGRSMCPHCRHELAAKDLVPVLSWLALGGKCRYCGQPISAQYPLVEAGTAALFAASYIWWPAVINGSQTAIFVLWLGLLTGLIALAVYDLRWLLLPNRLVYPLAVIASAQALIAILAADQPMTALLNVVLAVIVGGGIFYVLFQVSKGKWIGGGDVKLGALLGLIVATPGHAVLFIFFGSVLGSLVSLPLLTKGRLKRTSVIPFGPFLIAGAIVTVLFGGDLLNWYQQTFLML